MPPFQPPAAPPSSPIPSGATNATLRTCGDCKHGHIPPNGDMANVECFGAPPTPILMPLTDARGQPTGGLQLVMMRPGLGRQEKACGAFAQRLALAAGFN